MATVTADSSMWVEAGSTAFTPPVYFEFGAGVRGDPPARIEAEGGAVTALLQIEFSGHTEAACLPIESGGRVVVDQPPHIEALSTPYVPPLWVEFGSGLRNNVPVPLESRASTGTSLTGDQLLWLESAVGQQRDGPQPLEWASGIRVVADALLRLEWLALVHGDRGPSLEALGQALRSVDIFLPVETARLFRADLGLYGEALTRLLTDEELARELLARVAAVDTLVPLERWITPVPAVGAGRLLRALPTRRL